MQFQDSPGQVYKTPFQLIKKLDMEVYTCHISSAESLNRRIIVQAGLGINAKPYLKNN
jgi:hypothetical protein